MRREDDTLNASSCHNEFLAHVMCLWQAQGQHEEEEQVLRQCLAIQSHAQGSHHPKTGHALHDLAACLQSLQRFVSQLKHLVIAYTIPRNVRL